MANVHRPDGVGVTDLAKLGLKPPSDPRLLHVKQVVVDFPILASLLRLDGAKLLKMEGWPEGADCINGRIQIAMTAQGQPVAQVVLLLYHKDFPLVLAGQPVPQCHITINLKRSEEHTS